MSLMSRLCSVSYLALISLLSCHLIISLHCSSDDWELSFFVRWHNAMIQRLWFQLSVRALVCNSHVTLFPPCALVVNWYNLVQCKSRQGNGWVLVTYVIFVYVCHYKYVLHLTQVKFVWLRSP